MAGLQEPCLSEEKRVEHAKQAELHWLLIQRHDLAG